MDVFRSQMVEELVRRGLAKRTIQAYVGQASLFARAHERPPKQLGRTEVRDYLLQLTTSGLSPSTVRQAYSALRFLYVEVLKRPGVVEDIGLPKVRKKLPIVPSRREVVAVLDACADPFDRAFFTAVYAAGLRLSEALNLQATDIRSDEGVLWVRHGKGGKDRQVMLDDQLLRILRTHWRASRLPGPWLFPARRSAGLRRADPRGRWADHPVHRTTMQRRFRRRCADAQIRRVTVHGLRHAFATHLLEDGVDVRTLQVLLGHAQITTTMRYLQIDPSQVGQLPSPLQTLRGR